jgi:hypothetical protein
MKRVAFSFLCAIALISAAEASEGRTFFGLTFPETVGDARYGGFQDIESKAPGYGYSVRYSRPGWTITVFIYDLGRAVIPNHKSSGLLRDEFEQAKLDIRYAYDEVKPDRWFELFRADGQMMLCATFTITSVAHGFYDDYSFLAVTAKNNKFVKFRVTAKHTETSETDILWFVATLGDVLFPSQN